jgi:hypothetical protein
MTDISGYQPQQGTSADAFDMPTGPQITETYWGFSIVNGACVTSWRVMLQIAMLLFGAAFMVAALGVWLVPAAAIQSDTLALRVGLCVFMFATGYVLMSFGNRGTRSDWQFDQTQGEIRETVTNCNRTVTVVAQFGFDAFAKILIQRVDADHVALVLADRDATDGVVVATGTPPQIGALYARLDRDLLRANRPRKHAAVVPVFG